MPEEDFGELRIGDPQELRDRLGVQPLARSVLPFVDTRAPHWRYYLFAAPVAGPGRPIAIKKRLLHVLAGTHGARAGIGRREYSRYLSDGRKTRARMLERLARSFETAYGTATKAFWGEDATCPAPSSALSLAARDYVLQGDYRGFFDRPDGPDKVRHLMRARLVSLRRGMAEHLLRWDIQPHLAASKAASSKHLGREEKLLFCSWALLNAYFKIADDGLAGDSDDEGDDGEPVPDDNDDYYRRLAESSIDLLDHLKTIGTLSPRQVAGIRARLKTAAASRGTYHPPMTVWRLKADGRRRRVFASLRLYTYARLLRATEPGS